MTWGVMAGGHLGWGIIEEGWRKGPWTAEEDRLLVEYVRLHGEGRWSSVARLAGLKRNGKSCRLRWVNYLRPDLKRGQITQDEENIILELHASWGNRWSTIARSLPGRTDNEIKNYWRTHFKKKAKVPSHITEKSKFRLLRKQQFQQQQLNELRIMSLIDESVNKVPSMGTVCPNTSVEQGFFFNGDATAPPEASNEGILWDSLWNLDDLHVNLNPACATSKDSMHNLIAPFI